MLHILQFARECFRNGAPRVSKGLVYSNVKPRGVPMPCWVWLPFISLSKWFQLIVGVLSGRQILCLWTWKEMLGVYSAEVGGISLGNISPVNWEKPTKTGHEGGFHSLVHHYWTPRLPEQSVLDHQADEGLESLCLADFSFCDSCISKVCRKLNSLLIHFQYDLVEKPEFKTLEGNHGLSFITKGLLWWDLWGILWEFPFNPLCFNTIAPE